MQERGNPASKHNFLKGRGLVSGAVPSSTKACLAPDIFDKWSDSGQRDKPESLLSLVNEGAVKFLADREADSIKLENFPAYIREWIERVKDRTRRGGRQ